MTDQIADELQQRGVSLGALSQGLDATTPGWRLFLRVLAAIAEFEHDLIVEHTHGAGDCRHLRGLPPTIYRHLAERVERG